MRSRWGEVLREPTGWTNSSCETTSHSVLVNSTSSNLETDIRNHGFSVYVVPIVVEVSRNISNVAVRGCI